MIYYITDSWYHTCNRHLFDQPSWHHDPYYVPYKKHYRCSHCGHTFRITNRTRKIGRLNWDARLFAIGKGKVSDILQNVSEKDVLCPD